MLHSEAKRAVRLQAWTCGPRWQMDEYVDELGWPYAERLSDNEWGYECGTQRERTLEYCDQMYGQLSDLYGASEMWRVDDALQGMYEDRHGLSDVWLAVLENELEWMTREALTYNRAVQLLEQMCPDPYEFAAELELLVARRWEGRERWYKHIEEV